MSEVGTSRDVDQGDAWGLHRRPALPAAAALVVGIALHARLPAWPWVWLILVATCTAAAVVWRRSPGRATAAIVLAFLLAGVLVAQVQRHQYPSSHIAKFTNDTPRLAMLEMRIDSPPRILTAQFAQHRGLPPKQVTLATVTRARCWNGWRDATGQMLVQIIEPHPTLAHGQVVRVLGMLQRPSEAMNPGQFDWANYYREQRILASIQIPRAENIEILSADSPGWLPRLRARARRLLAAGFSGEDALDHALLRALLLGDSDPELRDVQEQFKRTGTSHHLAISGMHVAVLGGFVLIVLRLLRVPPRAAAWIVTAFVIAYGAVALPSPPVVRSVILSVAFAVGFLHRRSVDGVQLLCLSGMAILLYHPLDLYNAGFQLSFVTVLGLMLFTPITRAWLDSFRDQDVALARLHVRPTRWGDFMRWCDRLFISTLAAGMVAWAVSLPLIAYHFEQLNPWAILGSIFLAPAVFLALVGGLFKIVLTLLMPSFAGVWAALAVLPVELMRWMVDLLTRLPFGDVPVPPPPLALMLVYYLALLSMVVRLPRPSLVWTARLARAGTCAAIVFLPFHQGWQESIASRYETRVTLLGVGAGQCAVVEPPSGRIVLLDAGSTSLLDLLRKCLAPYLRHRGHTAIDTIVISHANIDHFSAVAEAVSAYDVREVLVGPRFREHCADNPPAEWMLRELDRIERPPRVVLPGDTIPFGREAGIEILWPPPSGELPSNDASVVLKLRHGPRSILFCGDIQEDAMRALLRRPGALKADVLIAPHHGSSEASTRQFVEAVDPKVIISSNDRTLTQKQRRFEQLIGDRPLLRTHAAGAITVRMTRTGRMSIECFATGERIELAWE